MILELMRSRRSIRRFQPEPPPRALLEQILEAAVTAPSASNRQPWRFFVVEQRACIDRMADAVREAVARVAAHVEPESAGAFREYGDYFTRFEQAPAVIAPLFRVSPVLARLVGPGLGAADRARIDRMEQTSSVISASLAVQNMLLMAHALGLGASAMTGPLLADDRLREILGAPEGWELLALIPVGYADEDPDAPERKPPARVVRWITG